MGACQLRSVRKKSQDGDSILVKIVQEDLFLRNRQNKNEQVPIFIDRDKIVLLLLTRENPVHSTQHTVHITQYTVHSAQYKVPSTKYTLHSARAQSIGHNKHYAVHTEHSTKLTVPGA
jgi:hypothetical protein